MALPVNSSATITNNILRTVKNGNIEAQIASGTTTPVAPDTSLGSFVGLLARGVANEVSTGTSTISQALDLQMPDTATGTALDRWLNIYGIPRRVAAPSYGIVSGTTSPLTATAFIASGTQLTSNAGLRYAVQTNGTYGNNSPIPVYSVDVGTQTDLEGGSTLQWVVPPAYFSSTVVVSSTSPITGASDPEDDGTARQRLLAYFANPPSSGNPTEIIDFATESSSSVQTAFVYPAARGAASLDVVAVGYAGTNEPQRNIPTSILTNIVAPYIKGNITSGMDTQVFGVNNYYIDVVIKLSLPYPATASPSGPGGGWLDPNPIGGVTSTTPAIRIVDGYAISGNTSGVPTNGPNAFWISLPVGQTLVNGNIYSISYLSPNDYTLYSAQTTGTYLPYSNYPSLSAHTSLVYIALNAPFYLNAITGGTPLPGSFIFPSAANTQTYVDAVINYTTNMGPGERTADVSLLPRSYRQPADTLAFPYRMDDRVVKPVISSGPEVYDGDIYYAGYYGTALTNIVGTPNGSGITDSTLFLNYNNITPSNPDPAYANSAPPTAYIYNGTSVGTSNIFVLNNFAIYRM